MSKVVSKLIGMFVVPLQARESLFEIMGLTGFDSKVNVCVSMSWNVVYPRESGTSTI